jgi:hypothetical protein
VRADAQIATAPARNNASKVGVRQSDHPVGLTDASDVQNAVPVGHRVGPPKIARRRRTLQ